jgi:hypothetical protein
VVGCNPTPSIRFIFKERGKEKEEIFIIHTTDDKVKKERNENDQFVSNFQ